MALEANSLSSFGYVEFANAADAAKAHDAMKGKMIDNREINIDFSVPRSNDSGAGAYQNRSNDRAKTYGDQVSEPSETLFVGNISFEATEDIVGEEFGKFGSVQSVRLPTDQETGNPKGFGYVQFASIDEAKAAFEGMKGAAICGRPIRLDYGKPRAANGDSPGGRGGRGGFSRGGRGGDRGGRGGGRGRGGFGDRGGRGGSRGGRGGSTNRGGFGDFQGKKMTF
jgi:nucleolin